MSSGTLPAGLVMGTDGVIGGTPTTAGASTFSVRVADANSASATQSLTLTIDAAPVQITTTTVPNGTVGQVYGQTLTASQGQGPYSWSVASGSLPAGLALTTAGAISGTPTAAGASTFSVQVADANSTSATQALTLTIDPAALQITTTTLPNGAEGQAYDQTLVASGGQTPYAWSLASGSLPAGLTLSTAGVLSGTPTTVGASTFSAQVTDANTGSAMQSLTLTIDAGSLQVTTTTLSNGKEGQAYDQTILATAGQTPYTWSVGGGTLPDGLTLSTAGVLSGTPTTAGESLFQAKVTDANTDTAIQWLTLTIDPGPVGIATTTLPDGTVGQAYRHVLAATPGQTPYAWGVTSGSLPNGLSLHTGGLISGTPTTAGASTFTVEVADANSTSASKSLTLTIGNPTLVAAAAAGGRHSMFVGTDGVLWGTGYNTSGQLGDGTILTKTDPVQVMTDVAAVSAGDIHTMILKTDGTLWGTGSNTAGQLGDGTFTDRSTPVQVMSGVASVSAGDNHTMIVKTDGTLWATGFNPVGQLGDPTTAYSRNTPGQVMTGVASVSAGSNHTMIVKTDSTLWATGWNVSGQLGDGTQTNRTTPVQIMSGVAEVAAGALHSAIIRTDGTLWTTGFNFFGQLGDGTQTQRSAPVQVMSGVVAVATGHGGLNQDGFTLVVKSDGTLWTMGGNSAGQLGGGTRSAPGTAVQVASSVSNVSAGHVHSLFVRTDGTVWGMGSSSWGRLGATLGFNHLVPARIIF